MDKSPLEMVDSSAAKRVLDTEFSAPECKELQYINASTNLLIIEFNYVDHI